MSWLAEFFGECVADEALGVIALRSPTGWGKTAEVAELYETLAEAQPVPRFWPPDFHSDSRKTVFPSRLKPALGSRLPYLWLGLRAELDSSGRPRFAGFNANGQLSSLLEPLATAIAEDGRLWHDRALTALKAATSLADRLLPVGDTIEMLKELTGIAQEIVELIPEMFGEAAKAGTRTERARRAGGGSTIITDGSVQARAQAERAGTILSAVSRVIPTVVVVEDAQFLDDHTVAMLRTWVRSELPVGLLVLTIATDRPGPGKEWRLWFDELLRTERMAVTDLDPLSDLVLEQLAITRLAEEHPGKVVHLELLGELILHCAGNPLTLHELLDLPSVMDAMTSGDRHAFDQAVSTPPAEDAGLAAAFDRLDPSTRRALSVLSLQGQASYLPWLDAGFRVGLDSFGEQAQALSLALESGWCEEPAPDVLGFVDGGCYRVACHARSTLINPARRKAVLKRLLALVEAARSTAGWSQLPTQARQYALEELLADPDIVDADLAAAMAIDLDNLYTDTGQAQQRRDLLDLMQTQLNSVTRTVADQLVITVASSLLDLGDHRSALRLFAAEHARLATALGADHAETLVAQHNLAAAQRAARLIDAAMDTYRDLLRRRLTTLPAHDRHIRDTRRDLAEALTECGRDPEARQVLQALHDDNVAANGKDHAETLQDDLLWYSSLIRAGAPVTAIPLLQSLLVRAAKVFGNQHSFVRAVSKVLARGYGSSGDLSRAIRTLRAVLDAEEVLLGPDYSDTLATRSNLADWHGEAGDPAGAVEAFEALL
ncbi:MAG TPA: tetratricopeptide repeat protein, partial [Jatrophihabitans sp.]|nr:tetratricopeptide repeat protein [Jatrophihabitans sp.]